MFGNVEINFCLTEDSDSFEIASGTTVNITETVVTGPIGVVPHSYYSKGKDHLLFNLTDIYEAKTCFKLNATFQSLLTDQKEGVFRWCNGQQNCFVGTMFKPTYARTAFPCFDDSHFKSEFNLQIVHHKEAQVYANTEVQKREAYGNRTKTTFRTTPKMSTYHLSFTIGNFHEGSAVSNSNVKVRTVNFANRYSIHYENDEMSQMGAICINTMEALLGVKFPLKKIDFIDPLFFPDDDGMDGFGLAFNPNHNTLNFNDTIFRILYNNLAICQKTATQWFGGLVTVDQWGQEFLQEGLAKFFEIEAVKKVDGWEGVIVGEEAKQRDTTLNYLYFPRTKKHPVITNQSYFDDITSKYGALVIRQIYNVIGEKDFYRSLKMFLTLNSFKTVNLDRFYHAFFYGINGNNLCGKLSFKDFVEDYLKNSGSPSVTVDYIDGNYKVTQKNDLYNVPLFVLDLKSNKEELLWLLKDGSFCSKNDFQLRPTGKYVFNNGGKGIVKVVYNEEAWNRIWSSDLTKLTTSTQYTLLTEYRKNNNETWEKVIEYIKKIVDANNNKIDRIIVGIVFQNVKWSEPINGTVAQFFDKLSKGFDINDGSISNQVLGRYLLYFLRYKKYPSICRQTEYAFQKFQIDCKEGSNVRICSRIPVEFREAVYLHGASTESGLSFLESYYDRILYLSAYNHGAEENRLRRVFSYVRKHAKGSFYC